VLRFTVSLTLTPELASHFARITLGHVTREYPYKPDHVLNGPQDLQTPREQHPIFYGSFDWHGCVLGYWLLSNVYRRFSSLAETKSIREVFDAHFTPEKVAAEVAYLNGAYRGTFERPYGWGWLLFLAAELTHHTSAEGRRWSATLAPLSDAFVSRFIEFLGRSTYPMRTGIHSSTAFALALALEYADVARSRELGEVVRAKCRGWYERDADCQAWEPGGEDFLSPTLVEAECMRRVLLPAEFVAWLDRFLPRLAAKEPATLFVPATVTDRTDGKIVHLDGLNFSRAWCLRSLARSLDANDPRRALCLETAETHLQASIAHVADHYMGEHWLCTYATMALVA
jgi:hypothetical protein